MEAAKIQRVEIEQATTCFPDLITKTMEGDEIVITKKGKPVVKFVAISELPLITFDHLHAPTGLFS